MIENDQIPLDYYEYELPKKKLFILGNGFDLSHNLPTNFSDFAKYLLKRSLFSQANTRHPLINILHPTSAKHKGNWPQPPNIDFNNPISIVFEDIYKFTWNSILDMGYKLPGDITWDNHRYVITGKHELIVEDHEFLKGVLRSTNPDNWIDFEKAYFKELCRLIMPNQNDVPTGEIWRLNNHFKTIRQEFEKYLIRVLFDHEIADVNGYFELLHKPQIDLKEGEKLNTPYVGEVMILNFNYTPIIENIYKITDQTNPGNRTYQVVHIHGEVSDAKNPIVFGYGDEKDPNYSLIESLEYNHLLEHFKSNQYSRTANYHRVEKFVENEPFQVDIIGHGCGMTDRVLLNYIFEHSNCDRIKIHHHKEYEGYRSTYMNLSRHFSPHKKHDLRTKVLPFKEENRCPQWDD